MDGWRSATGAIGWPTGMGAGPSTVSREIANRIPTAAKLTTSEVPPALTNGSVMPVTGRRLTTTQMLMKAWKHSQIVIPAASSAPNVSGARRAVLIPALARIRNRAMTIAAPTNPNSSPMIAKMKSFHAFGR
jgi:hypothetical protein